MAAQIDAVRASSAHAVFVPGNHDWDNNGEDRWRAIQRQSKFIDERSAGSVRLLPSGSEPDPGAKTLVTYGWSSWTPNGGCTYTKKPYADSSNQEAKVLAELRRCLTTNDGREVVVFAHHPLQTHGPHGGFATWQDHLFPAHTFGEMAVLALCAAW